MGWRKKGEAPAQKMIMRPGREVGVGEGEGEVSERPRRGGRGVRVFVAGVGLRKLRIL